MAQQWTLANIKAAVAAYVAAASQADASWTPASESFTGLIEKIMKTVVIDGNFNDKLPELDGDSIEFGQAIEEFYINMTAPLAYSDFANDYVGGSDEGLAAQAELRPYRPAFDDVAYSERLGRKVFPTTVDDENYKKALSNGEDYANLVALTMKRLYDAIAIWKYGQKKQLLGNVAKKVITAGDEVELAKPVDTATGEAFIKAMKEASEDASFVSEGNSLNKTATIGAEEGLVLYVKKGVMPSIEVDTLAGAFNKEDLAVPFTIKVVEDFGECTLAESSIATDFGKVYAILVDPRGVKLHTNISKVKEAQNAIGDYTNYFAHTENTGFISKYTFVRVYREA